MSTHSAISGDVPVQSVFSDHGVYVVLEFSQNLLSSYYSKLDII